MTGMVYSAVGNVDPWKEASERAKKKTEWQAAEIGDVEVTVGFSIEAIANNWDRVMERLEAKFGNRIVQLIDPCPAYDGWTVVLAYDSIEGLYPAIKTDQKHIERIVNAKR